MVVISKVSGDMLQNGGGPNCANFSDIICEWSIHPCLVEVCPDAPVPAAEGVRDGGAEHGVDVGLRPHGDRVQEGEVVDHPHAETAKK